jgi:hypothetical protein
MRSADQQDYQGTGVTVDIARKLADIFCLRYPDHPFTQGLAKIATKVLEG